jgi:hypothetical protein
MNLIMNRNTNRIFVALTALACLVLGLLPVKAETFLTEDFSGDVPHSSWRFFDKVWRVESYDGVPSLAPAALPDNKWMTRLLINFRPNVEKDGLLPLSIRLQAVVFANRGDGNRFSVIFYTDANKEVALYSAVFRPGGVVEIWGDENGKVVLARSKDKVVFPEGVPVAIQFIWHKDSNLEVQIDNQTVARTTEPVMAASLPFSICFWERFTDGEASNRVLFQKVVVSNSL